MTGKPRVWLLLGDKLGDNAQVEVVAECLDWPIERKKLVFKEPWVTGKPPFKPSLYHLDKERSDPLEPPWPDLILTIGRRPSMAALWVKRQSQGRTKLVLFGRPRKFASEFDLVVVPPQYLMPSGANVLRLELPLMRVSREEIQEEAATWQDTLAPLKKPLIGVFIGGTTGTYDYSPEIALQLLQRLKEVTKGEGTLYISTSRRTPKEVIETLEAKKPANAKLYRWGMDDESKNPYRALLAYADGCVVTSDSISMMVEVIRLGKPLAIYRLPWKLRWYQRVKLKVIDFIAKLRISSWLYDKGVELGGRNLGAFNDYLVDHGWAIELGKGRFPYYQMNSTFPDNLEKVVSRINELVITNNCKI